MMLLLMMMLMQWYANTKIESQQNDQIPCKYRVRWFPLRAQLPLDEWERKGKKGKRPSLALLSDSFTLKTFHWRLLGRHIGRQSCTVLHTHNILWMKNERRSFITCSHRLCCHFISLGYCFDLDCSSWSTLTLHKWSRLSLSEWVNENEQMSSRPTRDIKEKAQWWWRLK